MKKRGYKKYTDPGNIDSFSREEISSHSSLLTNRRLDLMFMRLDDTRFDSWNNICVPNLKAYFSVLSGIYNNVYTIFDEKENKQLKKYFDTYHELFFSLFSRRTEKKRLYQICYKMLFILDHLQRLLTGYLQKRQFFFRLERGKLKGIDDALKMYELKKK